MGLIMKAHEYSSGVKRLNRPHKDSSRNIAIILLLIVLSVLLCLIYRDRISDFIEGLADNPEDRIRNIFVASPDTTLTIDVDGRKYKVEAAYDNASVSRPQIKVGKNAVIRILTEDQPEAINTELYLNDVRVISTSNTAIRADELWGDGEYKAVCEVTWGGKTGTLTYPFTIVADFPATVSVSASETDPGELVVICVENLNEDEKLEVETDLDFKPNIYRYGNKNIVMLPVSYYNEPDKVYQVKLTMGDEEYSYALRLNDKEFITQYMTIDAKVAASTRNEKSAEEIKQKIHPLRPVSDPEPYWQGKFIMPVEGGRVTETDFGKKRYVNDSPTSYRHNGLDIGHDKGTPVMASNNGRVLLADYLIETGNTVIIEHGFGLKTWYYHMDELRVETGDWVKKGDIIGTVGSTGFSTGPHLHFSASVNEVYINPMTLINEGVPLLLLE